MSLWHQTVPGRALRFSGGTCPRCQSDLLLQGDVAVAPHPVSDCKVYLSGTVICVGCSTTAVLPDTGLALPQLPDTVDLGDKPLSAHMLSGLTQQGLHKITPAPVDSTMTDDQTDPDVAAVIAGYYAEDQVWEAGGPSLHHPGPTPALNQGAIFHLWKTQKAYKRGAIVICDGIPCIATKSIPPKWAFRFSDGWIALGSSPDAYKWAIFATPCKPTTLYKAGQMVTCGGMVYCAMKLIPGTSVFHPEDGWKIIEDPSAVKPEPTHGPYLGHWGPNKYVAADIVRYGGQYYRASRDIPADSQFLLDSGWELVDTQGSQSELASAVTTAEQAFKKLEQAFAAGAKQFGGTLHALASANAGPVFVSALTMLCADNGWSYQGSMQVHKTYYPNDVVIIHGEAYRCIEEATGLTYPPMSMKWQKLMQANAQQSVTPASETEGSVLPELSFEEKPLPALEWSYEYKPGLSVTTTNTKLLALCAASGFVYRGSWEVGHSYNAGDVITIGATAWLCNHTSMCNCSPVAANGHWTRLLN